MYWLTLEQLALVLYKKIGSMVLRRLYLYYLYWRKLELHNIRLMDCTMYRHITEYLMICSTPQDEEMSITCPYNQISQSMRSYQPKYVFYFNLFAPKKCKMSIEYGGFLGALVLYRFSKISPKICTQIFHC